MGYREIIVDAIGGFGGGAAASPDRVLELEFSGGGRAYLDTRLPGGDIRAELLRSLYEAGAPVYVEVEPRTRMILALRLPRPLSVLAITPDPQGGGMVVDLEISALRHRLRPDAPGYDRLLRELETALASKQAVWVTETEDSHEIIDVRPAPLAHPARD